MTSRPKKRQARRQRSLENDFNENGFDMDPTSGTFEVFDKKTKKRYRRLSWKRAVELWNELPSAVILSN